jgi:pseudouridine-5'-phosphate glycosidase
VTNAGTPGGELRLAPAVWAAIRDRRPVVALESSVIAQGLPAPANREGLQRMVAAVEAHGATPAIAAVAAGVATLGLSDEEIERFLARDQIRKVTARDLGLAVAQGADGATTVAATLAIIARSEVKVFATGGIGGIHREPPYDESADLLELSQTAAIVVCSGAKSILDLPATVERLESLAIPVLGYRTSDFPAFFSERSGLPVMARVETVEEIVRIERAHRACGRRAALLVVQPPPPEAALPSDDVISVLEHALDEARARGVRGPAMTPFLLGEMERRTEGRTLRANLALLEANAALAARIAVALR